MTENKFEIIIGHILRAGVIISALFVLSGGILYLYRNGSMPVDYAVFSGNPACSINLHSLPSGVLSADSYSLIQFGLLLLVLTPVTRVIFSLVSYVLLRDRIYTAVTLIVSLVLLYSLFG